MKQFVKILLGIGYWILSLTWGGLMTWIGLIGMFVCVCCGGKIKRNGYGFIVVIGHNWGGVNFGLVSFINKYNRIGYFEDTRRHEFGHSLQNIVFGPLHIFIVALPSAIRCWIYRHVAKVRERVDYYDIWFERTATEYGTAAIDYIEYE